MVSTFNQNMVIEEQWEDITKKKKKAFAVFIIIVNKSILLK